MFGRVMMLKSVIFLLAAAGAVHAQARPPDAVQSAPASRPIIDMSSVRASLDRAHDAASPVGDGIQSRTAIDYRLARHGAFGQLGYFCRSDASPIAAEEAAVHIDAKDDRLLGGAIRFPF